MEIPKWPEEISDEKIRQMFAGTTVVHCPCRNFNCMKWAHIFLQTLKEELPLARVLEVVGITPQMMRPMFNPQRKVVERWLLSPWRLGGSQHKVVNVQLPRIINSYDELGNFYAKRKTFIAFAKIIGKTVKVYQSYGDTCELTPLFTAFPSGKIEEETP